MSAQTAQTNPTIDPYKNLYFTRNPDGTITRNPDTITNTSPTPDPNHPTSVLSKDIPINQSNNTWIRIFLPCNALDNSSAANKLPLIVYYHGGGFVLGSPATTSFHVFCANMTMDLPAIIVSVEYRLAPEHRLPAAYDDSVEALHGIKTTQDKWLREYADYSNCYLMGTSSGGNIAYHAGVRAAAEADNLVPLKIKGLILHQPFFGGTKRTESELRLVNDRILPLSVADLMWELSLPMGADRDHEYSNPTVSSGSEMVEKMRNLGWRVLVWGCHGDPLIDRQIELVKMMEKKGVKVKGHFGKGDYHGVEVIDPTKTDALHVVLKSFVYK